VSSHALALDRVYGCPFHTAVFTNLTRDHLDFHGTMEAYFAEKRKLFDGWGAPPPAWSVLNLDDPKWHSLQAVQGPSKLLTYGLGASADVRPDERKPAPNNGCFTIMTPWGPLESRSPLLGRPNAYNVLAATAAALSLGIDTRTIEAGLAALESVPGRFEQVNAGQPFLVAVDYAHTDDALRSLLATARALLPPGARVITVFGCGGDRDRTKRPLMGEAAGSMSDLVVLTSDNPRSEDPLAIINDALPGLQKTGARYHLEPDRRKAIELAIGAARANDIVLIAGKGHEDYQVIGAQKLPFDDREVAREVLANRGYQRS
jgi:UDP-N-acetylmuramoyl-L-alanyl-D-glutamate--2,6-diaminopimelate ligase